MFGPPRRYVTERYNVLEPKSEGIFSLSVNTIPIRCSPPQPAFTIDITASYNNSNEESSMAILVVQFVSGYAANQVSLNQLLANELVKKTETSPSKVVIYLQKVGPNPVNFSFQMEQQSEVTDLKPAQMSLIEYYNPSHRTDVSYNAPCN
ncbi:alpha-2-macroglobulin-like [Pseudophryne corroboree]|uniref:alpha-2-macroglobulin-like n=1 Tax=Pseudophryne corroboree TaxID=495146 RepID=UPI003081DAE2